MREIKFRVFDKESKEWVYAGKKTAKKVFHLQLATFYNFF